MLSSLLCYFSVHYYSNYLTMLAGGLIVSTPQDVALLDARRGVKMFSKVNVPV